MDLDRRGDRPRVSVCVLNFNGTPFLASCLDHLANSEETDLEVIVVDNGSRDGSRSLLATRAERGASPRFTSVLLDRNAGYSGGHNAAARLAKGDYLAFLNASVDVDPGWLRFLDDLDSHSEVAVSQPVVLDAKAPGRVESMGSAMGRTGLLDVVGRGRTLEEAMPAGPRSFDVFSTLGAAFVVRRDVFESLGGFDESFFLYFEESDLCWRAWLAGHRVTVFVDPARPSIVRHRVHATIPSSFDIDVAFDRNRSLSMVKNLESRHLHWPLINAARVATELARRPRGLGRYLTDVVRGLPAAGRQRRAVQSRRRRLDHEIFAIRAPPGLGDADLVRSRGTAAG